MNYFPLSDNAARQYQGGMYWKMQGEYCYLVKTMPDNRQKRIGSRSPDTEIIYNEFVLRKKETEARVVSLRQALRDAERLNKALKVGRVPSIVVAVLDALEEAGIAEHFVVVGTHSLYAYESAAGIRIAQSALATQDVDSLCDARKKVRFMTEMERLNTSVLSVLQKVDASFQRKEEQLNTAINDKGFEVDFLRRMSQEGDSHPFQLSDNEDDLWVIQAPRANELTDARRFEHIVVSASGHMALMRSIDPRVFVKFKTWMANEATDRPALKRRRDAQQAAIVQGLLDEGLLLL